jgi:alpha/beta superfamily hydrolase
MNSRQLQLLARDLRNSQPHSPRETLGGFVFGASILDKCRADLLGIGGEHLFAQCALDAHFWKFTGLDPEDFRAFVATGVDDDEVGEWIERNASVQDRAAVLRWNFQMISNLAFASRFSAAVGIASQAATSQRWFLKKASVPSALLPGLG